MAKPEVKLNLQGISAVLKSAQPAVNAQGQRMARSAGSGFEYEARPAQYTARGYVQTASASARRRQATEHVLQRVVGGQS